MGSAGRRGDRPNPDAACDGPSDGSHQLLLVLGASGWLRLDYPPAHALPQESHIFVGDEQSYGGFETSTLTFEPVSRYTLQGERFSRYLLGDDVPTWPIETALSTVRIVDALFRSARSNQWEFVS